MVRLILGGVTMKNKRVVEKRIKRYNLVGDENDLCVIWTRKVLIRTKTQRY